MSVTIDDIAREAGVSKRTVSRVLNNSPYVNEKTREKIRKIIKKYKYNANFMARNLALGKGFNLVGLITGIEDLVDKYYFMEIIKNIERYLEKEEHSLFIINLMDKKSDSNLRKLKLLSDFYNSKVLKGFIILGPPSDDIRIKFLNEYGARGIVIGSKIKNENFGYIDVNNEQGAFALTEYLIKRGHKKIAIITGPDNLTAANERFIGYIKAMQKYNLRVPDYYVVNGGFRYEGGLNAGLRLLQMKDRPAAIFAANDDMARGVYEAALRMNLKIPYNLSVCGFDNINASEKLNPPLTTVAHPFEKIGKLAAESLIDQKFNINKELDVNIIIRQSVL